MIPDWDLNEVVNSKHLYLVAFCRRSITTTSVYNNNNNNNNNNKFFI